jgi:hypothetical protein
VHEDHAMMVNFTIGQADPVNAGGGICYGKDLREEDYANLLAGNLT